MIFITFQIWTSKWSLSTPILSPNATRNEASQALGRCWGNHVVGVIGNPFFFCTDAKSSSTYIVKNGGGDPIGRVSCRTLRLTCGHLTSAKPVHSILFSPRIISLSNQKRVKERGGGFHGKYLISVEKRHSRPLAYLSDKTREEEHLLVTLVKQLPVWNILWSYIQLNSLHHAHHRQGPMSVMSVRLPDGRLFQVNKWNHILIFGEKFMLVITLVVGQ